MNGASEAHPYCAVAVVLIPLDADGRPQPAHTVTVTGVGGSIVLESDKVMIGWQPDRDTGVRFTLNGAREWI
jgi:hypothetical protein